MAIIHYAYCGKNAWKLDITLNYINILLPVYLNVFLHSNLLQCTLFIKWLKNSKIYLLITSTDIS